MGRARAAVARVPVVTLLQLLLRFHNSPRCLFLGRGYSHWEGPGKRALSPLHKPGARNRPRPLEKQPPAAGGGRAHPEPEPEPGRPGPAALRSERGRARTGGMGRRGGGQQERVPRPQPGSPALTQQRGQRREQQRLHRGPAEQRAAGAGKRAGGAGGGGAGPGWAGGGSCLCRRAREVRPAPPPRPAPGGPGSRGQRRRTARDAPPGTRSLLSLRHSAFPRAGPLPGGVPRGAAALARCEHGGEVGVAPPAGSRRLDLKGRSRNNPASQHHGEERADRGPRAALPARLRSRPTGTCPAAPGLRGEEAGGCLVLAPKEFGPQPQLLSAPWSRPWA